MRRTFPRMAGGHGHVEGIVSIPPWFAADSWIGCGAAQ